MVVERQWHRKADREKQRPVQGSAASHDRLCTGSSDLLTIASSKLLVQNTTMLGLLLTRSNAVSN